MAPLCYHLLDMDQSNSGECKMDDSICETLSILTHEAGCHAQTHCVFREELLT